MSTNMTCGDFREHYRAVKAYLSFNWLSGPTAGGEVAIPASTLEELADTFDLYLGNTGPPVWKVHRDEDAEFLVYKWFGPDTSSKVFIDRISPGNWRFHLACFDDMSDIITVLDALMHFHNTE